MARSGRPPKIDPLKPVHRAVTDGEVSTSYVELAAGRDINRPKTSTCLVLGDDPAAHRRSTRPSS